MINFIRIYLFSYGLLSFISYSKHSSVIYNNKNYGSLPYILFIAAQNSRISLDRPQCIAICSKFKMALLLLKNSIELMLYIQVLSRPIMRVYQQAPGDEADISVYLRKSTNVRPILIGL